MPGEPNTPGRVRPSGDPAGVIVPSAGREMIVWSHDRWSIPLPDGHRFPISKYELLRRRVEADGVVVRESDAVAWGGLGAVHDGDLLERIREGTLTLREQRGLGLPWSQALVERSRRS